MSESELMQINGGAKYWGLIAILGGLITFFAGLIDGVQNPLKCK